MGKEANYKRKQPYCAYISLHILQLRNGWGNSNLSQTWSNLHVELGRELEVSMVSIVHQKWRGAVISVSWQWIVSGFKKMQCICKSYMRSIQRFSFSLNDHIDPLNNCVNCSTYLKQQPTYLDSCWGKESHPSHAIYYMKKVTWNLWVDLNVKLLKGNTLAQPCMYIAKRALSTRSLQLFDHLLCCGWVCMTSNWRYFGWEVPHYEIICCHLLFWSIYIFFNFLIFWMVNHQAGVGHHATSKLQLQVSSRFLYYCSLFGCKFWVGYPKAITTFLTFRIRIEL